MATNFEEVKYIFTGDTSNLSEAVSKSIGLLDQYGNEIRKVVTESAKMKQMGDAVAQSGSNFTKMAQEASKAGKEISSMGKNNSIDGLNKKVTAFALAMSIKFPQIAGLIESIAPKFVSMAAKSQSAFSSITKFSGTASAAFKRFSDSSSDGDGKTQKVTQSLSKMKSVLSTVGNGLKTAGKAMLSFVKSTGDLPVKLMSIATAGQGLKSVFATLTGIPIGNFFAEGIKYAMNYTETLNQFTVVMGEAKDEVSDFVSKIENMYGLDTTTIMSMTSQFYQLASAIEMPVDSARKLSTGLTTAALDISSLFDADFNKVAEDLSAGMQGMTRSVRKYGIDLRQATLETTAASLGLKINAATTSEANRQALRYITIIRQARASSGDFAKTLKSPANQLRVLKEQFQQLARAIGSFFLPVLQTVLPYINGIIMALVKVINFVRKLLGLGDIEFGGATDAAQDLGGSMEDAGDSIDDNTKKAKKLKKELLAGIDELNILNEDKGSSDSGLGSSGAGAGGGGLDPALAKAIADLDIGLTDVETKANKVRDAILGFLGLTVDDDGNIGIVLGGYFDRILTSIKANRWKSVGFIIADMMNRGIDFGLNSVDWNGITTKITTTIGNIGSVLNGIIQGLNWAGLGELFANGINTLFTIGTAAWSSIDWTTLGTSLATGLNSMLTNIDWSKIGEYFGTRLQSLISLAWGFFKEFDFSALATDLATYFNSFINSVDWGQLGETLWMAIKGLLEGIMQMLGEIDWINVGAKCMDFLMSINWVELFLDLLGVIVAALGALFKGLLGALGKAVASLFKWLVDAWTDGGKDTAGGLLGGIVNVLKSIGTWIKKHVFTPIWNSIKSVFGIGNGESSKLKEIGEDLLNGLLNGIKNIGNSIKEWAGGILDDIKGFFGINSPSKKFKEIGEYCSDGLHNGMDNVSDIGNMFEAPTEDIKAAFETAFKYVNTHSKTMADGFIKQSNRLISKSKTMNTTVKDRFKNMADTVVKHINKITKALKDVPKNISTTYTLKTQETGKSGEVKNKQSVKVPKLASGGVVKNATMAMIGEGAYPEAVVPLGNSPQLAELVDRISEAVNKTADDDTPISVTVNMDSQVLFKSTQRASKKRGVDFKMGAFAR